MPCFRCSAAVLVAFLQPAGGAYLDAGEGKCVLGDGTAPSYSFYKGKGPVCEALCDETSECHGYSVSNFSNCLLWEEPGLVGGGAKWGSAHCLVQQYAHISARTTQTCGCTAETCYWQPAPECVTHFEYNDMEYTNCTTTGYKGKGWCSLYPEYQSKKWKHCALACPEGCYWQHAATCVPRPLIEQPCWTAPKECVPEFWYKGKLYAGCTQVDGNAGAWCSQTYRYTARELWSQCTPCCQQGTLRGFMGATGLAAISSVIGMLCVSMPMVFVFRKRLHSPRSIGSWALTSPVEFDSGL
mmetsp:Transcript_25180/g.70971  ORF Transcript_25180/g.70971 Transcript_25180/m.70971 type:complete len:298 (-) Transcript_25180:40-933(-)|eukprot:CAMPEP_0179280728 /NCGR_PEP_ID=MMETSP0797-20121207/36778_1 /TAXON_ID=47934 /ORGANISM="Dinophysis acuminata, Strain DAEP01" /LENGTH=297 /DNA_ID=CAMNT_0020989395 /DNA_START=42 /DNA_END=935 /DNA_ORIENTATION=+